MSNYILSTQYINEISSINIQYDFEQRDKSNNYKNLVIFDKSGCKQKVNALIEKRYAALMKKFQDICDNNDDSSDSHRQALDEATKFAYMLNNKYQALIEKEKQLEYMERLAAMQNYIAARMYNNAYQGASEEIEEVEERHSRR